MPFLYHLHLDHTLSTTQLRQALQLILTKHPSLRTSLIFDKEKNLLMQKIIDSNDNNNRTFEFIESTFETDDQLNNIMHNEKCNSQLFDLAQGLVFRCHLVYYKEISSNNLLSDKDALIFNFHHALFDYPSMNIFLHDLNQAYSTGQLKTDDDDDDDTCLRYLDCEYDYNLFSRISFIHSFIPYLDAVIEQQMPMTAANMFWHDALQDSKIDQSLSLPYDRYRLSNEHRTGRGTSISFDIDEYLSQTLISFASSNNIKLEHVAVAIYYAFLFKLTNGEKDLCIGINTHGRYNEQLMSVIGMFVNAIPLRCQLESCWSFHQLVEYVSEITTNCLEYSYFPLQRILAQHPNVSKPTFLDISFEFELYMRKNDKNQIMIGDSQLYSIPVSKKISEDEIMSKIDFALTCQHHMNINQLSCTIDASLDLFNVKTIDKIAQQFYSMLEQLFTLTVDQMKKQPIYELSLILPDERRLMQSINNTQILFPSVTCIHHEFVCQAMKHAQKLAVELDDQSLTYSELLYYVQLLSLNLSNKHEVTSGEIICQCIERSLSMVS